MLCARPSHICAAQMMVELRGSKAASTKIDLLRVSLELRFETDCIAARGRNGVTGEQSRKVYEIERRTGPAIPPRAPVAGATRAAGSAGIGQRTASGGSANRESWLITGLAEACVTRSRSRDEVAGLSRRRKRRGPILVADANGSQLVPVQRSTAKASTRWPKRISSLTTITPKLMAWPKSRTASAVGTSSSVAHEVWGWPSTR